MIKKLTAIILTALLCAAFFACGDSGDLSADDSSDMTGSGSQAEVSSDAGLTYERALELINNDETLTQIFFNNRLALSDKAQFVTISPLAEFGHYADIEALFAETYDQTGGTKEFFESWPLDYCPAVSDNSGRTRVFYHAGSRFDEHIDVSTVEISDPSEGSAVITALTDSGEKVELECVYNKNSGWLLTKGLYRTLPEQENLTDLQFPDSRVGSLSAFKGNLLIIELYISDKTKSFDDEEQAALSAKIGEAVDFVKEISERFGNTVNITREKTYFRHKGVIGGGLYDIDLTFAETSLKSIGGLVESAFDLDDYDGYMVFACIDDEFTTSAQKYASENGIAIYYTERVTVNTESTVNEMVFGILDLLGAYDYSGKYNSDYLTDLFDAYFPNDYMNTKDISNGEMSPLTAYICGFTDEISPLFRPFVYKVTLEE